MGNKRKTFGNSKNKKCLAYARQVKRQKKDQCFIEKHKSRDAPKDDNVDNIMGRKIGGHYPCLKRPKRNMEKLKHARQVLKNRKRLATADSSLEHDKHVVNIQENKNVQIDMCEENTVQMDPSTSTAQPVPSPSLEPSSSQEHQDQDPNAGCSNADDIPLDLEIFEESNIEEPTNIKEDTTENAIFTEKLDAGDIEKPETNNRKTRKHPIYGQDTTTRKPRPEIGGIKITFCNIDKFGEQITFILKRLPGKLCRELQDTIVTLIKTATENREIKTKKNVASNTKKIKTSISRTENDTKRKKSKQLANQKESASIDSISDVIMEEYTPGETAQATELLEEQLGTTPDQRFASRVRTIDTFPKPMTLPIVLMGSMDCVKQEVLDPEDSNDSIIDPEQYNEATTSKYTLFDPFKTNIKIDIDETNLIEQAKRRENSQDKYV